MMPILITRRLLAPAGVALLLAVSSISSATEIWFYTLGEMRANQQGNFCTTRGEVAEIANIFRKYGVRPGFSALSASPYCEMRVDSFTPLEIVEEVDVVTRGAEHEYTISFIRVEIQGGGDSFLITTREVRGAR
ncbi:MAG TPA: hypothetical protein VLS27_17605 [Gammaproteobacteria bacterium]|nr:hypothetical protein [Gammaproteobacteria bacterium]